MKKDKLFLLLGIGVLLIASFLILDNKNKDEVISLDNKQCISFDNQISQLTDSFSTKLYSEDAIKFRENFLNNNKLEGNI